MIKMVCLRIMFLLPLQGETGAPGIKVSSFPNNVLSSSNALKVFILNEFSFFFRVHVEGQDLKEERGMLEKMLVFLFLYLPVLFV